MIKTTEKAFVILIVSILALMAICFAESQESYADENYKFKVTVYSGRQGTFGGQKKWTKECEFGEHIEIDLESLNFKLSNKKYYPRGFRITGHDNDETTNDDMTGAQSLSFDVKRDVTYEVAYGIKGSMVKYKVKYVDDETGKELRKTDTYYGMPGDKPLVSYRYIDGYDPDTYNKMRTLSEDESKNVYVFKYGKEGTTVVVDDDDNGNANNPANPAAPAAPGTPGNPAGTNVNPPGNETIDDGPAPTAPGTTKPDGGKQQTEDLDPQEKPTANFDNGVVVALGTGLGVFLLLLLILLFLRRRKKDSINEE